MIEPVSRSNCDPVALWDAYNVHQPAISPAKAPSKDDIENADEEVVSFYYLSSIQSLQASDNISSENAAKKTAATDTQPTRPSVLHRFSNWLWGLFGVSSSKENVSSTEEGGVPSQSAPGIQSPHLQPPGEIGHDRLSKAIAELNKELLYRMKDTAEFEAEMLKSNSKKMDRLILVHIVAKSLDQKNLKEVISLEAHENVLDLQNRNKDLHKKYFRLIDDINATAKTNAVLHWVNVGTTAGIVGLLAVSFATSGAGAVLAIALPALNILKGGLTAAEGVLKYKNDLRSGELVMVNHQEKTNRNKITDEATTTIPFADDDISNLLKTIRHHLENYSKEARLSPQQN